MQPFSTVSTTATATAALTVLLWTTVTVSAFHVGITTTSIRSNSGKNSFDPNSNSILECSRRVSISRWSSESRSRSANRRGHFMTFMDDDEFDNEEISNEKEEDPEKEKENDHDMDMEQTRQMLEKMMNLSSASKPTMANGNIKDDTTTTTTSATTSRDAVPDSRIHISEHHGHHHAVPDPQQDCTMHSMSAPTSTHTTATTTAATTIQQDNTSFLDDINIVTFLQNNIPPALHLTKKLQGRGIQEIQLLSSLLHNDDPIPHLRQLWKFTRGTIPALKYQHAMHLLHIQSFKECQSILLQLVLDEFDLGFYWMEPLVGLSNLYYMKGRYEDAKSLLEIVLEHKPWHVDAVSSMILVCTITNDVERAKYWSTRRMPVLHAASSSRKREEEASYKSGSGGEDNKNRNADAEMDTAASIAIQQSQEKRLAWVKEMIQLARVQLYNDSRVGKSIYNGQEGHVVRNFRKELELKLKREREMEDLQQQHQQQEWEQWEEEVPREIASHTVDAWQ